MNSLKARKPIRLLLVEDHEFVRQAIKIVLQIESDIEVVAEASSGREAIALSLQWNPDIILMDIAMPKMNGLEAARQIIAATPLAHVLILSGYGDDTYLEKAVEIGVKGFIVKSASSDVLVKAIRAVAAGKAFFSASVSDRAGRYKDNEKSGKRPSVRLTSRETEVLQLLAEGLANKQSAITLGISIKTVEKHRQSLMDKLGIRETAGLTRYAITHGIIENGPGVRK